ncbi:MAG: hypothetical protein AAB874_02390 [Patescibacteria group bacterium]
MDTSVSPSPVNNQPHVSPKHNPTLLIVVLLVTAALVSAAVSLAIFNTGKGVNQQPINATTENPFDNSALAPENPFSETAETTTVNPFDNTTTQNPFDAFEETTTTNTTEYQNPF